MNDAAQHVDLDVNSARRLLDLLEKLEHSRDSQGRFVASSQWYNGAASIFAILAVLFGGLLFVFQIKQEAGAAAIQAAEARAALRRETEQIRSDMQDAENRITARLDREKTQLIGTVERIESRLDELNTWLRRSASDEPTRHDGRYRPPPGTNRGQSENREQFSVYSQHRRGELGALDHAATTGGAAARGYWLWRASGAPAIASGTHDARKFRGVGQAAAG